MSDLPNDMEEQGQRDKDFWIWVENYMRTIGWGKGTEHNIKGLVRTVDSFGTDGMYIWAICTTNGQPQLGNEFVKFTWPDPIIQ